mgnify:CR=1 FL=1
MKELELKYGCNPNQKPSKIYMEDGSELPIPENLDILIFWMHLTAGSWCVI